MPLISHFQRGKAKKTSPLTQHTTSRTTFARLCVSCRAFSFSRAVRRASVDILRPTRRLVVLISGAARAGRGCKSRLRKKKNHFFKTFLYFFFVGCWGQKAQRQNTKTRGASWCGVGREEKKGLFYFLTRAAALSRTRSLSGCPWKDGAAREQLREATADATSARAAKAFATATTTAPPRASQQQQQHVRPCPRCPCRRRRTSGEVPRCGAWRRRWWWPFIPLRE